ncbi:MAG: hypothetical protein U0326_37950 [Polyangiales bacterium]
MRLATISLLVALAGCETSVAPPFDALAAPADAALDASPKSPDAGRVIPPCPTPVSGDGGVTVRGHAFDFGPSTSSTRGGVVTLLEHPGWCARIAADSSYSFQGLTPGERVTPVFDHPDYWPIQTGTHVVPEGGIERLSFQAPTTFLFDILARSLQLTPDPARCQIASTVTEVGFSIYDGNRKSHGEAGATVSISPPLPPESGPVYFQYYGRGSILPVRELTETTRDGGVLYLNVPPGEYVLSAHKAGATIRDVRVICRAGVLTNAAPSWGLQTLP